MKVLVDENIPLMTAAWLRDLRHDVKDMRGSTDKGLGDTDLWALALRESRMLITTDKASPITGMKATLGFWWSGCGSQTVRRSTGR